MTANVRMQAGAVLYKKGKDAKYFKQQPLMYQQHDESVRPGPGSELIRAIVPGRPSASG